MSDERVPEEQYFAKGCLRLVAVCVFSLAVAAGLAYAAQWLFGL